MPGPARRQFAMSCTKMA